MKKYGHIIALIVVSFCGNLRSAKRALEVRPQSSLARVRQVETAHPRSHSTEPTQEYQRPPRLKKRIDQLKRSLEGLRVSEEGGDALPAAVSPKSVTTQGHQVEVVEDCVPPALRLQKRRLSRKKALLDSGATKEKPVMVDAGVGTVTEPATIPAIVPLGVRLEQEQYPEPDFGLTNPQQLVAQPMVTLGQKKIVAVPIPKKSIPTTIDILRGFLPQNEHRTNPAAQVFSIDALPHDDVAFLESGFLWLYEGSCLGSIPGINPDFIKRFGSQERLNIGGVFSFAYQPAGTREKMRSLDRDRIEASLQPPSEARTSEVTRISVQLDRFALAHEELRTRPVFFSQAGIAYCGVALSFRIDPFTFQPWRDDVDECTSEIFTVVSSIDRLARKKKNSVIADDPTMDRTVMLLACWLIYQGWGINDALEQARSKRLEHRELHPHYRYLVNAFAEKMSKFPGKQSLLFELSAQGWTLLGERRP